MRWFSASTKYVPASKTSLVKPQKELYIVCMLPEILNLNLYRQTLEALRRATLEPKNEFLRDSVIQRFEFTYELAWKSLKRYLEQEEGTENIDALPPSPRFIQIGCREGIA